jgi:tRNA uridine 5-carboxymethylaminomethyl modification enzyme
VASGADPVLFDRASSYTGVMIDDLVIHGVSEPYRMFTSRAEFRIKLRADNADDRLTPLGIELGMVGQDRRAAFEKRAVARETVRSLLDATATTQEVRSAGGDVSDQGQRLSLREWLRFPGVTQQVVQRLEPALADQPGDVVEAVVTDARYDIYLQRAEAEVARMRTDEAVVIPGGFTFAAVPGLSREMAERLERAGPETLGQASRVRGITPAALTALVAALRKKAA